MQAYRMSFSLTRSSASPDFAITKVSYCFIITINLKYIKIYIIGKKTAPGSPYGSEALTDCHSTSQSINNN